MYKIDMGNHKSDQVYNSMALKYPQASKNALKSFRNFHLNKNHSFKQARDSSFENNRVDILYQNHFLNLFRQQI